MSKVLVTGGAGFIGSHLVDKLITLGHQVVVIDNESAPTNSKFYWNPAAENYQLDITDYEKIAWLFSGVDYVFHTAAQSRVQSSIDSPLNSITTNVVGTGNVLEASKNAKVKRVIYSMTSSVYGSSEDVPHKETQPPSCLSPYAVSKYAGEQLCMIYANLYQLETVSLRYFNIYGDREPSSGPYATVISKFIEQHKAGDFLTIVGDGEQRRDFTNVKDAVEANIAAMNFSSTLYGEIFNIGTGRNFSVNELAQMISTKYRYLPLRPGEARVTLADSSKAKSILGWQPIHRLEDYLAQQLN